MFFQNVLQTLLQVFPKCWNAVLEEPTIILGGTLLRQNFACLLLADCIDPDVSKEWAAQIVP